MSSPDSAFPPIPRDTRQSANRILDADSPWRRLGEQMDSLFVICVLDNYKEELKENPILFLQKGMMTFLQWQEQLTDCQSAEASRSRIEWKYVLHLSLNHPGFQASTFCVFRQQLIASPSLQHLYQRLLERTYALELWPNTSIQPPFAAHMLAALCELNQTSWMREAFAQSLEALAVFRPDWLRQIALPHWYTRYAVPPRSAAKSTSDTFSTMPQEAIQQDINHLFRMLSRKDADALSQLPEIRRLRWGQRYRRKLCERCSYTCVVCTQCIVGASIVNRDLEL